MAPESGVFEPLERGGQLAERTYVAIRSAVLDNRLPPGTSLSVPELARQLGVSRSPVREAVQRLIYEGLATHVPNRGAEVSQVDLEELRDLYVVRELLEGLAARLATENADQDGLHDLHDILERHEKVLAEGGEIAAHIDLDRQFHRMLRELAGSKHLDSVLEPIAGRSHSALHSLWRGVEVPRLALAEHREIVAAMVTGDPEEAEAAARRHIARLRVRLRQATPRSRTGPASDAGG